MALDAIRQNLAHHREDLLPLIRATDSMEWVSHSAAYLQLALVIGRHDDCCVLAFTKSSRDKTIELYYCSIPIDDHIHRSWLATDLTQDAVGKRQLITPFKYVTGVSQHGQSMFSAVILWYFLGLSKSKIRCDIDDYCSSLLSALRRIRTIEDLDEPRGSYVNKVAEDEDEEPEGRRASWQRTTEGQPTASSSGSASSDEAEPDDCSRLVEYLDEKGDTLHKSINWIIDRITKKEPRDEADEDRLDGTDETLEKLEIGRREILARRIKRREGLEAVRLSVSRLTTSVDDRMDSSGGYSPISNAAEELGHPSSPSMSSHGYRLSILSGNARIL